MLLKGTVGVESSFHYFLCKRTDWQGKSKGSFEDACQHEEGQIQDKDEGTNEG